MGIEREIEEIRQIVKDSQSPELEKDWEELRQLEKKRKKYKKLWILEIPAIILAILLLYFLIFN